MFIGLGTAVNVATIIAGSSLGLLVGRRLTDRVRSVVTVSLGLVTLVIAAQSVVAITDPQLATAVGSQAPLLILLGALTLGGMIGAGLRLEDRLGNLGAFLRKTLTRARSAPAGDRTSDASDTSQRFIDGFVTASLVFCVGPLAIMGPLNEGLGAGPDQLLVKSMLDGFAALAFSASFGIGVIFSAVPVLVLQGSITVLGVLVGSLLPEPHVLALTATGGLILVALAFRLLELRDIPVADLLPALVVAPILVQIVSLL